MHNKVDEAVGALTYLERKLGTIPSVAEIAEEMNVSPGTAWKFLKEALDQEKIVQRNGRFMTLRTAKSFDEKG